MQVFENNSLGEVPQGLGGGADDPTDRARFVFGPFELDPAEQVLARNGQPLRIQPQPLRILALLVSRPDRLITRDEIRQEIWGDDFAVDYEHGLNFAINQIRSVLGDSARNPRYVETVPRAGYRFVALVRRMDPVDAAPIERPHPSSIEALPTGHEAAEKVVREPRPVLSSGGWRKLGAVAWVAAMVAVSIALWIGRRESPSRQVAERSDSASMRLAVLPFESVGSDPVLAKGLTFDLIASLGRQAPGRIEVIGHRSMIQFRESVLPASEIGRQLDADLVIEGQIKRHGDRLRLQVMIVDAADETVLWTTVLDRGAMDLVTAQQEIAARIVEHLLPSTDTETLPERADLPVDPGVYRLYADARWRFSSGGKGPAKAIDLLREVVRRQPNFAAGQAALASMLALESFGSSQEALAEAWAAAETALALNPSMAEAHFARGLLQAFAQWDFEGGRRSLTRALELEPSNAQILSVQASLLAILGDFETAAETSDLVVQLDPIAGNAWIDAGFADYLARRFELASDRCERGVGLAPISTLWASLCFLNASERAGDVSAMERAVSSLIASLGASGKLPDGISLDDRIRRLREILVAELGKSNESVVFDYLIALQTAALGRSEETLSHLEAAHRRGDLLLPFVVVDPVFDFLQEDSRFRRLVAELSQRIPYGSRPSP